MNPGIVLKKLWFDDDAIQLKIDSSDGNSFFCNYVYVGQSEMGDLIHELERFREQVFGGLYDIQFGSFGPECAGGAFHARLHFQKRGKIYISVKAQSEYHDFGKKNVACKASLFLITEPVLLDNFIAALKGMNAGTIDDATLEAISGQEA